MAGERTGIHTNNLHSVVYCPTSQRDITYTRLDKKILSKILKHEATLFHRWEDLHSFSLQFTDSFFRTQMSKFKM